MSRPLKCRQVCFTPGITYFKPAGIPMKMLEENCLSIEELEAVRLRDMEHLEQIDCAKKMNISRPTFQRVLASARKKIADSLLSGKALRIQGGNYQIVPSRFRCGAGHEFEKPDSQLINPALCPVCHSHEVSPLQVTGVASEKNRKINILEARMKIAVVTEDGKTISQHFGRATQYIVLTAENGKIVSKETRDKVGHSNFASEGHHEGCGCGEVHGYEPGAYDKHRAMAQSILDCSVLLAGGMGMGAYEGLKTRGIEVFITDVQDIEEAVNLYLRGELPNLMERLH